MIYPLDGAIQCFDNWGQASVFQTIVHQIVQIIVIIIIIILIHCIVFHLALIVQKLDSTINWINYFPADKY